jgi:dTDP-4-amino-4,6-dideoxygalactose transaminase
VNDHVPFNDLSRSSKALNKAIAQKAAEIAISGTYILGPEVAAFEDELADYLQLNNCIGVASGTDALSLSLLALGVKHDDSILTMANAGCYTTIAARSIGADPVFVDVSPNSLQMTLEGVRQSLAAAYKSGLKPKAIVVTHLFGQLNQETEEIASFAKGEGLSIIEDCAQALGARNLNGMAGSFGDLSTFSFYPTKNLGASGDGGAVAGNSSELSNKVRKLRQYGWSSKYSIDLAGGRNSRLDEIQAAILRIKLPYLDAWNEERRRIFQRYLESASSAVKFYSSPSPEFVGHLAPITVSGVTQLELTEYFEDLGIQTSIHFPVPDHKQTLDLKHRDLVPLPVTERSCESLVTLPIFPEMSDTEISRVSKALSKVGG